jgi:hypothetical protein
LNDVSSPGNAGGMCSRLRIAPNLACSGQPQERAASDFDLRHEERVVTGQTEGRYERHVELHFGACDRSVAVGKQRERDVSCVQRPL